MEEKEKTSETTAQVSKNSELDTAQVIEQLKAQVDSLTEANSNLEEAKRAYYDKVLNGSSETPSEEKHRTISEIKADMTKGISSGDMTNLDYCKLAVELDDECRRVNNYSAFLPKGKDVQTTVDEYNTADKMNAILKECIEESDNDPVRFNMALKAHMPKTNR